MLTAKEYETLVRLLRLTESDKDGEALAALRRAQTMLARHGMKIADLLRPPAVAQETRARRPVDDPPRGPEPRGPVPVDFDLRQAMAMTAEIIANPPQGSTNAWIPDFCRSLAASMRRYGRLTPNQWQALRRIYRYHGVRDVA